MESVLMFVAFMWAYFYIDHKKELKGWDGRFERRACNKRNRLKERRKA